VGGGSVPRDGDPESLVESQAGRHVLDNHVEHVQVRRVIAAHPGSLPETAGAGTARSGPPGQRWPRRCCRARQHGPRQIPVTARPPVPAGRAAGHPQTAVPGEERPGASLAGSPLRTDPYRVYGGQAGDANGRADVTCGRRRDGASWLAWMSIRSGRYVPSSENSPGQPVALECPQRPRGGVRPAAEFVRQFCFRRQPGPRRVLAAPDPPREHGVNVLVGPRVLPRIIHDQPHGQCKRLQPLLIARAPPGTPARGRTYRWFTRG
jgi:hypothetical protein